MKTKRYQLKKVIRSNLKENIKNYLNKSDAWKNQLALVINFLSSKDFSDDRAVHSGSDSIKL